MKDKLKSKFILYLLLIIVFHSSTVYANLSNSPKNQYRILFISSYSYAWDTVPRQIDGILESLDQNHYTLDYEFMDTKNTNYSKDYQEFYQYIKYKLDLRQAYDGIIVGDDNALQFATLYRDELFLDIPIIFQGIDNVKFGLSAAQDPLITGVIEKIDYAKNLQLAYSLFPDTKEIILIFDSTENGIGIYNQIKRESEILSNHNISYLNTSHYTKEEFQEKLKEYDQDSIIFGLTMGKQKGDILYNGDEIYDIFRKYTKAPVFRISNEGVGKGPLGGYIVDHKQCGYLAGEMLQSALENDILSEIEIDTPSTYIFDYNILKEYEIGISQLPIGSIIINQPENFFNKYNIYIITILSASLIVSMFALYYRSKSQNILQKAYDKNQKYTKALAEQEAYIRHQAEHDYLTDLPNRLSTVKKLDKLFAENKEYTLLLIDIDDFKEINNIYGQIHGDYILKVISKRLSTMIQEDYAYVSRFGGNEFLLIIEGVDCNESCIYMDKIKNLFIKPIPYKGIEHCIKVSIGIVTSKDEIKDTENIISNAYLALNEAKNLGKNTYVYYNEEMKNNLIRNNNIKDILNTACEENGFYILYQPQIDTKTEKVCRYEALVRLKDHPIPPNIFIDIAENTDLILQIGRIVTKKVILQLAKWRDKGVELHPVAINFSTKQIRDKGYLTYLKDLLEKYNIDPELIEIEFTESIFLSNTKDTNQLFQDLLSMGINLTLDDFGTGYSSISYLTYIPISKIKLDKSLVDIFLMEGKDAFIENIIRLAHSLGLEITVEGVETKEQYEKLRKFNCDYIQGYYFSKPITGKEIEELQHIYN